MLDCSRNAVPNIAFLKKYIDILARLGYNELQLYTEDLYEIEGEPYFGYLRGRFTREEIKEIDGYCGERGIKLVPCIQTLAHLDNIFRWKRFSAINDAGNALLADSEETYAFIEEEFKAIADMFSSDKINIGMDEAHFSGLGKHLKKFGYENPREIFFRHLKKVCEIAKKYGFKPMMWSDMFFKYENDGEYYSKNPVISEKTVRKLPEGVTLCYWDYNAREESDYAAMIESHKKLSGDNLIWTGAAWSWLGLVPHNDYSLAEFSAAFPVMKKHGVKNYMLAEWGDDGAECSKLSLLPSLFAFSEMAKGNCDLEEIKSNFGKTFGISFDDFLAIDLPNLLDNQLIDVYNPSKYMLYNDCFSGVFDSTVDEKNSVKYAEYAKTLAKLSENEDYGYIFATEAALCRVLENKYSLGVLTRLAYKSGDKRLIEGLICKYEAVERGLNEFYKALKNQWNAENKPFGFEVQTARLGGLMLRVKDCRERLLKWLDGEIEKIPELEEEILDINGNGKDFGKKSIVNNSYRECVTTGYN